MLQNFLNINVYIPGRVFQDPMTGTAATMGIEENLALAKRRGKSRLLRSGITKAEREEYKRAPENSWSWSGRQTDF